MHGGARSTSASGSASSLVVGSLIAATSVTAGAATLGFDVRPLVALFVVIGVLTAGAARALPLLAPSDDDRIALARATARLAVTVGLGVLCLAAIALAFTSP